MWKSTIFTCFLVIGLGGSSVPNHCCPEGSAILKRKAVCWNPILNSTTPYALNCTVRMKFPDYSLKGNGQLELTVFNNETVVVESDRFCLGNVTTIQDPEFQNLKVIAVVCSDERNEPEDNFSGYFIIVSVIFLMLTAAIYAALPPLRDLQGKSIISFCVTFALGLALLAGMKLTTYSDMTLCAIKGFFTYYFILSGIFWTNAIAIQILLSIRRPSTLSYEWKDFTWYAVYAWGVPALLTLIMALVNFLPGNHSKPGIGLMTCWFYDKKHQWYYMYSVWSILLIANCGIFIYTSICLWRNTFSTTHTKALKYKFLLSVRLVVVLGITWVLELISSVYEYSVVWLVFDIFNIMQGVFVFLVLVVFRKRVLKVMYKRGWLDCCSGLMEKHLAKADDDEQDVVEHTRDVQLEDQ